MDNKKINFTKEWLTGFTSNVTGVIIGIALTFGITSIIQHRQERQQTKLLLSMVRDELKMNIEKLGSQKEYMISQYVSARALMPYVNTPETIPTDTINKYFNFLVQFRIFDTETTSLEVLKNSSQIETFSNKELISELFNIYRAIDNFYNEWNASVASIKQKCMNTYLEDQMDSHVGNALSTENAFSTLFADIMKKNTTMHNHIILLANEHGEYMIDEVDELSAQIEKEIAMINEEIE